MNIWEVVKAGWRWCTTKVHGLWTSIRSIPGLAHGSAKAEFDRVMGYNITEGRSPFRIALVVPAGLSYVVLGALSVAKQAAGAALSVFKLLFEAAIDLSAFARAQQAAANARTPAAAV